MIKPSFYGSTSVSDKGQVVIPAEAREALGLNRGDKLMVLSGPRKNVLILVKPDKLRKMVGELNEEITKFIDISSIS
jgi:AbrB family looped-hinge helix DNA binding protein